jgi:plasmid stabilization system protein ParE
MVPEIIFTEVALKDIEDACAWYDKQTPGTGERFYHALERCFQAIQQQPEMFAIVKKDYRRGLVPKFPYMFFYKYSQQNITIHGVFHCSRNPTRWQKRLK